jgi:hypothetical protein
MIAFSQGVEGGALGIGADICIQVGTNYATLFYCYKMLAVFVTLSFLPLVLAFLQYSPKI